MTTDITTSNCEINFLKISNFHFSTPVQALYDFVELDRAVELAQNMTNIEETLILVSADHR